MSRARLGRGPVSNVIAFGGFVVLVSCVSGQSDTNAAQGGGPNAAGTSSLNAGAPSGSGGALQSGSGGVASVARGGSAPSTGGAANGGTPGSAGSTQAGATQGGVTSGGQSGVTTGGTTSNGGAPGAGGSVACTDTPPNNGDTCAHAVEYKWCGLDWMAGACARSCGLCGTTAGSGGATSTGSGGRSATTGGTTASGGGSSVADPPRINGGTSGWATRYWDCCKPACGWKANVPSGSTPVSSCSAQNASLGTNYDAKNACESGGSAYMCQNFGPWAVSNTLAYGFAAVSKSDYCGRCYQLQFTGGSHNATTDAGSQSLSTKTLIVQAINNGGVGSDQFDILIPGGGVGDFDACSSQWGVTDLGARYGGFFLACQQQNNFDYAASKSCAAQKCQSVFASKPDLLAGCMWFVDWFGAPDNPALVYQEVTCPAAITAKSGLKR